MKRYASIAILAAGCSMAIAISAVAFGESGGSANQAGSTQTMTLKEVGQSQFNIDNTPKNKSRRIARGDAIVFTKPLAKRSGKRVAKLHGVCYATSAHLDAATCHGMIVFKNGTLAFSESFDPRTDAAHQVAVTGGTGAYEGAQGAIVAGVNGGNDYLFTLSMP
jgi:Dirigent-like protein